MKLVKVKKNMFLFYGQIIINLFIYKYVLVHIYLNWVFYELTIFNLHPKQRMKQTLTIIIWTAYSRKNLV